MFQHRRSLFSHPILAEFCVESVMFICIDKNKCLNSFIPTPSSIWCLWWYASLQADKYFGKFSSIFPIETWSFFIFILSPYGSNSVHLVSLSVYGCRMNDCILLYVIIFLSSIASQQQHKTTILGCFALFSIQIVCFERQDLEKRQMQSLRMNG